jgi:S-adenosyl methyltransferase
MHDAPPESSAVSDSSALPESPALNPAVPNVARMYDYMLGGKENYASDRHAVGKLTEMAPQAPLNARQNRAFLGRAVRFVVSQGVTQFLDVGAGLPTQENVHEVAQTIAPDTRTVYVDNDPVVLSHARALLSEASHAEVVAGDVRHPASILGDPHVRALLDFDLPVCVLLVAILHFVPDADDPAVIVAAFRDAVAPGSYLILSHATMDGAPPSEASRTADAEDVYDQATARLTMRDPARVAALLDGFSLVEPGLVHVTDWRPDGPGRHGFDAFLGAVGLKE